MFNRLDSNVSVKQKLPERSIHHDIPLFNQEQHVQLSVLIFTTGNAGDSLTYHNGMMFTTKDEDNDRSSARNCAVTYKGAWWHKDCHNANLNGLYLPGDNTTVREGVNWKHWRGQEYSLKKTEIKIRPPSFQNTQQSTLICFDDYLVL